MSHFTHIRAFTSCITIVCLFFTAFLIVSCGEEEQKPAEVAASEDPDGPLLTYGPTPIISVEGAEDVSKIFTDLYDESIGMLVEDLDDELQNLLDEKGVNMTSKEYLDTYIWQEGEFFVTPAQDHYKVTFPSKTVLVLPKKEGEIANIKDPANDRIEISHQYALEVRPTRDPSVWEYVVQAPAESFAVSAFKNGTPYKIVSFKGDVEENSGMWHTQLKTFVQANSIGSNFEFKISVPPKNVVDVSVNDNREPNEFVLRMGSAETVGKMTPDENNVWSGDINSKIENINVIFPKKWGGVSIYSLEMTQALEKIDPAVYEAFYDIYQKFILKLGDYSGGAPTSADQQEALKADTIVMLKELRNLFKNGFEGMGLGLILKDLKVVTASKDGYSDNSPATASVDDIRIATNFADMHSDQASMDLSYAIKGLYVDQALLQAAQSHSPAAMPTEFFPRNMNWKIDLDQVPVQSLLDLVLNNLESSFGDRPLADIDMMKNEALALLDNADTVVALDKNYIGNDIWLFLVDGHGQVDRSSMYNFVGELELRLYGLTPLLQALNQRTAVETDVQLQKTLRSSLSGLTFIKAFGQEVQDDKGNTYRGYTLSLTPEGQVQLNGADLMQMMGVVPPPSR